MYMFTTYSTNYFFTLRYDLSYTLGFLAFKIFISLGCKRFCQKNMVHWLVAYRRNLSTLVGIYSYFRASLDLLFMYALTAECTH